MVKTSEVVAREDRLPKCAEAIETSGRTELLGSGSKRARESQQRRKRKTGVTRTELRPCALTPLLHWYIGTKKEEQALYFFPAPEQTLLDHKKCGDSKTSTSCRHPQ